MLKESEGVEATLPAQDMNRARAFYEEKLGLTPGGESPDGGIHYHAGRARFLVFPTRGRPSGDHTQLSFAVKDVRSEVEDLMKKGVKFEEYDFPEFKTERGIVDFGGGELGAWFKDSEGNLLALFQATSAAMAGSPSAGASTKAG